MLDDPKLDDLLTLIRDSFRVHPNRDPVYVDVGGNLGRVSAPQHQVIFGRRGSGKSCLLVHFHRGSTGSGVRSVYISCDEIKRLGYPDLLIRLLLKLLESLPQRKRKFLRSRPTHAGQRTAELRRLLDVADEQKVSRRDARRDSSDAGLSVGAHGVGASAKESREQIDDRTSDFLERKLDALERHLDDYKQALIDGLQHLGTHLAVIVDDFYLIPPRFQPDVIDYLHRLLRGTDAYLKVGTIRHRTKLARYDNGQTIGIEPNQDFEPIDLDQTFADVDRTHQYLRTMLDRLGEEAGIVDASKEYLSPDGLFQLTLASGGVPRDYLNFFVEAVRAARALGQKKWVTPKNVYKGAARESYRTKLRSFRDDDEGEVAHLERLFTDLLLFCLLEKRKTAFLVSQQEAQSDPEGHELVHQLMDLKLIHVIESDTSAASGRTGRYEAYTLDFSAFMEPRKRGIEIVEFWKYDESSRPKGVREAPVYTLAQARAAAENPVDADAERAAESVEQQLGVLPDEPGAEEDEA